MLQLCVTLKIHLFITDLGYSFSIAEKGKFSKINAQSTVKTLTQMCLTSLKRVFSETADLNVLNVFLFYLTVITAKYIYFYMYAFSRRFYSKRLTFRLYVLYTGYTFFVCVFPGNLTHNLLRC